MPFQALDFDHDGYHNERMRTMSWDDKVASYILALNWSRTGGLNAGTPTLQASKARQRRSHVDCVAVAYVNRKWYIASNVIELTDHEIVLTDASIGRPVDAAEYFGHVDYYGTLTNNYEIVREGGDTLHAEMKILKRLKSLGLLTQCPRMGVSKPCCPKCKDVLNDWQIDYTSYHTVMPGGDRWVDPGLGVPSRVTGIL
jgi:hypothetical protein